VRRERALRLRPSAMILAAVVAAALVLLLVVNLGQGSRTASAAPGDGTAEFHIDVTGVSGCSTGNLAGPNDVKGTCTIPAGSTFTVNAYIDGLGTGASLYHAFAIEVDYTGVTSKDNPSTASWPDCVFATSAGRGSGLFISAGCAIGVAPAPNSTYLGKVFTNDFNCMANGTISIIHGTPGQTKILADNGAHTDGGPDVLNINCGGVGGPTATPGGPTPTPSLTPTPGGPTPTPTPTLGTVTPAVTPTPTITPTPTRRPPPHILLGDVDGDGTVGARDALWVLWFDAGIVIDVPIPEAADVNRDDVVDALDALDILWADAGQLELL
jgi:hypothetical protein